MNTKRAFTLVELLVVIVIIGILAAIITVAVAGAWQAMQRGVIATQMSQIGMALDRYRAEFGEYPPDMFDDEALVNHVRRRWPRLNWQALRSATPAATSDAQAIRIVISEAYGNNTAGNKTNFLMGNPFAPLGALPLWLGGFPNADGKLSGFNADPENPFFIEATTPITIIPPANRQFDGKVFIDLELGNNKNVRMIDFDKLHIVPVIGTEVRNTFVPIVYFRGRADGGEGAYRRGGNPNGMIKHLNFTDFGLCVPYMETATRWHNPTTYQLIHPGLDGKFGVPASSTMTGPSVNPLRSSTGDGITLEDLDNLTNFSDFKELRSILP